MMNSIKFFRQNAPSGKKNLARGRLGFVAISLLAAFELSAQTPKLRYPYVINDETNGTCEIVVRDDATGDGIVADAIAPTPRSSWSLVLFSPPDAMKLSSRIKLVSATPMTPGNIYRELRSNGASIYLPTLAEARLLFLLRHEITINGRTLASLLDETEGIACMPVTTNYASNDQYTRPNIYASTPNHTVTPNYDGYYMEINMTMSNQDSWPSTQASREQCLPIVYKGEHFSLMKSPNLIVKTEWSFYSYSYHFDRGEIVTRSTEDRYLFILIE